MTKPVQAIVMGDSKETYCVGDVYNNKYKITKIIAIYPTQKDKISPIWFDIWAEDFGSLFAVSSRYVSKVFYQQKEDRITDLLDELVKNPPQDDTTITPEMASKMKQLVTMFTKLKGDNNTV